MRRLLQIGTILLLLVTLVTPISEYFDHWDAAGLSNDTEFRVFCVVFLLCLVLIVVRLIAAFASRITLTRQSGVPPSPGSICQLLNEAAALLVPPALSPPLRI